MALIFCPECGKQVSDRALTCPQCGFPIQEELENLKEMQSRITDEKVSDNIAVDTNKTSYGPAEDYKRQMESNSESVSQLSDDRKENDVFNPKPYSNNAQFNGYSTPVNYGTTGSSSNRQFSSNHSQPIRNVNGAKNKEVYFENKGLFILALIISFIPILDVVTIIMGAIGISKGGKKNERRGAICILISILMLIIFFGTGTETDTANTSGEEPVETVTVEKESTDIQEAENTTTKSIDNSEVDDRADWARLSLPYPDETEIIQIEDINELYNRFTDADEDKWYEFSGIVYLVDDSSIMLKNEIDSTLGVIQLEFPDESQTAGIVVGDSVHIVAHSYMKVGTFLMMNSPYIKDTAKTAYSVDSETYYVVDDYVDFWRTFEDSNDGIKVQITVPIDKIDKNIVNVTTGLDSGLTSMITIYLADDESSMNLKLGDTVTFYGTCGIKLMNAVSIDDAHIGEAPGETKPYSEVVFYKGKESDSQNASLINENVVYEKVTAQSLINELDKNAMNAKNKYENNYIEVTGYVCNIDASGDYFSIGNGEAFELYDVQCFTQNDAQKAQMANLSMGQSVAVKGKVCFVGEIMGYGLDIDEIK